MPISTGDEILTKDCQSMKLSISVAAWDFLPQKANLIEKLLMVIPKRRDNVIENISEMVTKKRINGIELVLSVNNDEEDIRMISKLFNKYNIPVLSVHQAVLHILKINISSIEFLFKAAKILSVKIIVIHLYAMRKLLEKTENIKYLKGLERKYKISIGLENSSRDIDIGLFSRVTKRFAWEEQEFTKTIKELEMRVTFDTTHLGLSAWGITKFFLQNQNRIINIHLSDYKNGLLSSHLPLGKGLLPIKDFLNTLKINHYRGLITLEINDNFPEIIRNVSYVRNIYV